MPSDVVSSNVQVLTVTIDHKGPIELAALSDSFHALAEQHARVASQLGADLNGDEVRLFVREIRSGSIIVELVALAATMTPLVGGIQTVVKFGEKLRDMIEYFRARRDTLPPDTSTADVAALERVLNPVAGDRGAALNIVARENAQVVVTVNVPSNDANAIQNRARHHRAMQKMPESGYHSKVLLYFQQVRGEPDASTGDRAVVESISPKPVKAIFSSEAVKSAILSDAIFKKAYVVDVDVHTIQGKPYLYKILDVFESFDREG